MHRVDPSPAAVLAAYKNLYNENRRPPSMRELANLLNTRHGLIRDRLLELDELEQDATGTFVPVDNAAAIRWLNAA